MVSTPDWMQWILVSTVSTLVSMLWMFVFDAMDVRFDGIDARLDAMDVRFDEIDARFNRVENRLEMIDLKCDTNRKRLDDLSLDVKLAERDIRKDIKNLQDTTETLVVVLQGRGILPDPGNTIQTA